MASPTGFERSPGDQGFPKGARIRNRAEYRLLTRRGRRYHTPHFVVLHRPGSGSRSRTGITASRKVGNAVVRNRLKRWIREFARTHRTPGPQVWDVVWIIRARSKECTYAHVCREMADFYRYLGSRRAQR